MTPMQIVSFLRLLVLLNLRRNVPLAAFGFVLFVFPIEMLYNLNRVQISYFSNFMTYLRLRYLRRRGVITPAFILDVSFSSFPPTYTKFANAATIFFSLSYPIFDF